MGDGVAVGVAVGARVAVGWAVGSGLGVAVGSGVGVLVGAGVGRRRRSWGGPGTRRGRGWLAPVLPAEPESGTAWVSVRLRKRAVAVGSGTEVGPGVCVGVGVSARAWVAGGCAPVSGSGVGVGCTVAVGVTGILVIDAGAPCSPPQAARAVRTARHMRTSVGAGMVPGNLRCLRAMVAIVRLALRGVNEAPAACALSRWSTRFRSSKVGRRGPLSAPG